jgi:tetratricopeptide (TPR) repeat protein
MLPLTRDLTQTDLAQHPARDEYVARWKERLTQIAAANTPEYWYDFNAIALQPEAENLRAALNWARDHEDWDFFLALVTVVCWYFNFIGLWNELINTAEDGAAIARWLGSVRIEFDLRAALLAFAYGQQGDFGRAIENAGLAIEIARDRLSDCSMTAFAICRLAQAHRKQGDLLTAQRLYAEAESLLAALRTSHRARIAILFELGKLARDNKEWDRATAAFNDVRIWLDEHPNDPLNQSQLRAAVLGHLALVEYYQGHFGVARADCLESLRLFGALNLRVAFGPLFWRLALIEHALGDHTSARDAIAHAETWFSRLGMTHDLKASGQLRAEIEAAIGDREVLIDGSA